MYGGFYHILAHYLLSYEFYEGPLQVCLDDTLDGILPLMIWLFTCLSFMYLTGVIFERKGRELKLLFL